MRYKKKIKEVLTELDSLAERNKCLLQQEREREGLVKQLTKRLEQESAIFRLEN